MQGDGFTSGFEMSLLDFDVFVKTSFVCVQKVLGEPFSYFACSPYNWNLCWKCFLHESLASDILEKMFQQELQLSSEFCTMTEFNFICRRLMSTSRRTRACKKTNLTTCNLQSRTDKSPLFRPLCV